LHINKIISKVLANRLKVILPDIILPSQSAFILGWLIIDNSLVAFETLHMMHSCMYGKAGFIAIKLDMSKAYDRVEWCFLKEVMKRMGFANACVNLIIMCVRTANFAMLINGNLVGQIYPSCGIRQGDHIAPYLFLLCAEALSTQLTKVEGDGLLRGVSTSRKGARLNHLFFADDNLLFCKANIVHWHRLSKLLSHYEKASGQRLNKQKTAILFSRNTLGEE
jgi:hypothetical protein